MTFKQAQALLEAIAPGHWNAIDYRLQGEKDKVQTCGVYLDGTRWHCKPTWEQAFDSLMDELYPENRIIEGAPA